MISGHDYKDYLLFNADLVELTNEPIGDNDLFLHEYKNNIKGLNDIYSQIWSCNLLFGFVILDNCILLLRTDSEMIVRCTNLTTKFIEHFCKIQDEIYANRKNKKPHK